MSSKSDNDNRSNQLNPNNSAYHSSRGDGGDYDDDQGSPARLTSVEVTLLLQPKLDLHANIEREFFACFVCFDGYRKLVRFRIVYEYSELVQSRPSASESAEDLGEDLLRSIRNRLSGIWSKPLAMSALFNESGTEFVWMTNEYRPGPSYGSSFEKDKEWAKAGHEAVQEVRELMSNPADNYFLDDWGVFCAVRSPRITDEHIQQISDLLLEEPDSTLGAAPY